MAIQFQGADEYKSKITTPSIPQLLENKQKITSARDEWYRRQALAKGRDAAMAKLGADYKGQIDLDTVQDFLAKAGKSDLAQPIIGSYTDADVARTMKDIDLQKAVAEGQMMGYLKQGQPVDRMFNPEAQKTEISTQFGDKIVSDSTITTPTTQTTEISTPSTKYNFITEKPSQQENVDDVGTEMNLGEGKIIAATEGKLPDIGSQSTAVERIIPEQIPSISQAGRGMWKGFTPPKETDMLPEGSVSGGLWKYSLPTGDQKQFATEAARALGLRGTDIDSELDLIVNESIKMPSSAREFLTEYSPKGMVEAQGKYLQAQREVLDKRNALKKQMAEQIAGKAQEMFGRGITKAGEERAIRKQNIDLAELDPTTNPAIWKPTTPANLTKIYDGVAGIADMEDALTKYEAAPGLSSIVEFAVAKLKANGQPVTNDAVENFILGTGVVPKIEELKLKKALRDLNIVDLVGTGAISKMQQYWDSIGLSQPNVIDKSILEAYIKNAKKDTYTRGGNIPGYTPSAKDTFEAKKEESKSKKESVKTGPSVGDVKTFPNGNKAKWDGKGWVKI